VISTRWVRKLKTPSEALCRLVAREFNTGKRDDTFAATSSSAGSRVVDLLATKMQLCTATADVSVAFLHAPETELVFVEPPEGHHSDDCNDGDCVRRLKKRCMAKEQHRCHGRNILQSLLGLGFTRGVFEPTPFHHVEQTIYFDTHTHTSMTFMRQAAQLILSGCSSSLQRTCLSRCNLSTTLVHHTSSCERPGRGHRRPCAPCRRRGTLMTRRQHLDSRRRHLHHRQASCVLSPMMMMNYWWVTTRRCLVLAWGVCFI
jgi:hypothetical protein